MPPMTVNSIAPIAVETLTKEQLGRAADRFVARSIKQGGTFPKDTVQDVLEQEGDQLADEMFNVFRVRVERRLKTIIHIVKVDRTKTPQEAVNDTGRKQYVNSDALATMPQGEGDEVPLHYFKPDPEEYDHDGWMSVDAFDKCLSRRGLVPDPQALLQDPANDTSNDSAFADEHPTGSQWRDANGKACYAAVFRFCGDREVFVNRSDNDWNDNWWLSGVPAVRKSTQD